MNNRYEVLCEKEIDICRVRKEIASLRLVTQLMAEEGDVNCAINGFLRSPQFAVKDHGKRGQ